MSSERSDEISARFCLSCAISSMKSFLSTRLSYRESLVQGPITWIDFYLPSGLDTCVRHSRAFSISHHWRFSPTIRSITLHFAKHNTLHTHSMEVAPRMLKIDPVVWQRNVSISLVSLVRDVYREWNTVYQPDSAQ
jgi:hypothetical protein